MKRPLIIQLWLLSLCTGSLVWSAETAPSALPIAFLQQLPMLLELSDEEMQTLLQPPQRKGRESDSGDRHDP